MHACDVRDTVLQAFAAEGGLACATPAELGAQCDVVVTLVVNAAQTDTVLFGEHGAVAAMKPGGVVIASATVAPDSRSRSRALRPPACRCSMRRYPAAPRARPPAR